MKKKWHYEIKEETLTNIKNQMKLVLSNYKWKDYALNNILDEWKRVKQPLFDIFSQHPNWNEDKLMIQFDTDYSREFDNNAVNTFYAYLRDMSYKNRNVHWTSDLPRDESEALSFIYRVRTQFFEQDEYITDRINDLNRTNDNFKLRKNMKSSKAIGKICNVLGWNQFEDYNKKYAALCDALNPIKVKRHTVISLNPVDYLLMSNGNSWNSCHKIIYKDNRYESMHTSGTISYMLDPHSFVFYTVDASFDGTDIELEPKVQRQIFGYKKNVIFQSRLYPQNLDRGAKEIYTETREIVQKIFADCLNIPNLWVKVKSENLFNYVARGAKSTAYPDFRYQRNICTVSIHKATLEEGKRITKVSMGKQPICIKCGERHSVRGSLYCRECRSERY